MILTCPACATSYFISDDAVGSEGRKVRCQACGEVWHATPDEPLELGVEAEARSFARPDSRSPADDTSTNDAASTDAAPSLAETPAPELPKAFRARAEQQRRTRQAATHGAIWGGLACTFLGLIAAAFLFRVQVVDAMPRAAAAYALVGAPVNAVGLDFEALQARDVPHRPEAIVVSGAVRNVRDREIVVPPIRIALLDEHGAEIGFKIVQVDAAPVLPGKVQGFAAVVPNPGSKIVDVGVDFMPEAIRPSRPAAAPAAAPVAPKGAETLDQAALAHAAPPAPASVAAGLRPATDSAPDQSVRPAVDMRRLAAG